MCQGCLAFGDSDAQTGRPDTVSASNKNYAHFSYTDTREQILCEFRPVAFLDRVNNTYSLKVIPVNERKLIKLVTTNSWLRTG